MFVVQERAFFTGNMEKVIPAVEALLGPLNTVLKGRDFLVADRFTVADQAVAGHIGWAAVHMEGVKVRVCLLWILLLVVFFFVNEASSSE